MHTIRRFPHLWFKYFRILQATKKKQLILIKMSTRNWNEITSKLNGIDRYNPQNIPILEEYVQYQLANKKYNLDANLALLKL
jgi:hypothetical protein